MSLTLFNDFTPLFAVLDDPFFAASSGGDPYSVSNSNNQQSDANRSGGRLRARTPRLHLTEDENKYVAECELPGVRKENLNVHIGDGGRSLTIEGSTRSTSGTAHRIEEGAQTPAPTAGQPGSQTAAGSQQVATTSQNAAPATEEWSSCSSFSRTVWLPRPVDPAKVKAKLDHGILTLEIPKKDEIRQARITID